MKIEKNRKMKGSVLLTVVSVMALLIIFMASAVVLSNSMNNRAHANYSDSQAEYTAKAAIQGFTQALEDNDAVAQTVLNMAVGDVVTPVVKVNDKGMGNVGYYDNNDKWVKDRIKIEYVKDNMAYDEAQKAWVPMQVIKITATGKVGKQEKNVSYFIERAASESHTTSIKGFQTLGGGGHQNNGEITGALTMGLEQNGKLEYGFKNDYNLNCDTVFVNGHFTKTDGNSITMNVIKPNTQFVVMGDFTVKGGAMTINVDYPYGSSDAHGNVISENMSQQSIPYLYVKGNLGSSDGNTMLTVNARGANNFHELREKAPFNIFAGTIGANTSNPLPGVPGLDRMKTASCWGGVELNGADLYLMNDLSDPSHESRLDPASSSKLYKWSSSVLNGTSSQFYSEGGSIYCNHNLTIGKSADIEGNLVVEGNLTLNERVNVGGDLVVKGTINNTGNIGTVGGKIYYNGSIASTVYTKHNAPAEGRLKPDSVKVENYRTGNVFVPNLIVSNIPVHGDVVSEENMMLEGYTELKLRNGRETGYSWQDETGNAEVIKELGFADGNDFNNNGLNAWINNAALKPHLSINENYDGQYGREITIIVKRDETGKITDYKPAVTYVDRFGNETYDIISYYFVNGGTYTPATAADAMAKIEYYVADPTGVPTTAKTNEPYTIYRVNYDGTVTNEVTTEEGTYYVADQNGNATANVASTFAYYYVVDPATKTATANLADGPISYYRRRPDGSFEAISEAEAYEPGGMNLYKAWYNESTIIPDEFLYYKEDPDPHISDLAWLNDPVNRTTAEGARSAEGYYQISTYPGYHDGSVYPANMLDSDITVGDKKIVMSLTEARKNIGMNADGTFADGMYTVNFDSNTVGFKEPANTYTDNGGASSAGDVYITKSGTITGKWEKDTIWIKPKDATDVINIVLKDVDLANEAKIVVGGKGLVNFLLEGTNTFSASEAGIYTENIYKKWKSGALIRINETDKLNSIMYGKEDSVLTINNTGIVCAVAKCPYTSFKNPATQGLSANWKYVMKDGGIWEPTTVNWVGSALFKDAETNDNFALLYTNSADGADDIHNDGVDGANWYGKYYDAY